ncbi:MAG: type 1 glutamine amidotransferase [Thermoproteota archaeon]|nr:type 1 glutamine amidotransferase [Thermoproteota archaeon]
MPKILSVQNIQCETLGLLEQMFLHDGYHIEKVNTQNDAVPTSSLGYDAIVILGGPMAVYDNLPYLQKEQELIRNAMKNDTPVLGICLGSQLIAQAAGGRVYKGKKKEIGWYDVYLTPASSNDIFRGFTDKMIRIFQWHGDTYDLPANAKVLAYSDLYPQAFRIGSAVGIQFHFEVDEPLIQTWMKEYRADLIAEKIRPESILPAPCELEELLARCRHIYNNFVRVLQK